MGVVIFPILYIFSLFIFTVHLLFNCSVFVLGKGPLIRHFLSFGPIPEPIIYIMVNGLYALVVNV